MTVPAAGDATPRASARVLGPYTLLRLLGRGGMGAVWEAVDFRLDRRVALKEMLAESTPDGVERFRREALNSARLSHPNIVSVHDVGSDAGRQYLVMDLVVGVTLGEALRAGRWSYREKAALLEKICRAVHYAHGQGVIHRDLKPANIMLARPGAASSAAGVAGNAEGAMGEPVIMDFGLAKDITSDSSLSRSGQAMGTPSYMPPEQAEGRLDEVGPRSDVYSLGAVLYEMLTGRPPFTGESVLHVLRAVLHDDPVPPRRISPDVGRDLETICLTCLAKLPGRRYATAGALADDLRAWLDGESISARPATWVERSLKRVVRHRAAYATAAAAIAILLASSGAFVWQLRAERDVAVRSEERARTALAEGNVARAEAARAERVRREEEERRRALEAEAEAASQRDWRLVLAEDFSDPAATARRWTLAGEHATVADGVLRVSSASPVALVLRERVPGDVRIDWECRFAGRNLDDLSCFLSADDKAPVAVLPRSGYELKSGAFGNTRDLLLRGGRELFAVERRSLEPDRTYRARAERLGRRLRLLVDDRVVFDQVDPRDLPSRSHGTLGLTAWHADAVWDNVRVYSLGAPLKADLLEIAERHLVAGRGSTAADLYAEVLESATDETRRAAARAGIERTRRLAALSAYRRKIAATWAGAQVLVEDVGDGTLRVTCDSQGVSDLSPLMGMPVSDLALPGNRIVDLSPIADLPLRRLVLVGNAGLDIAPLDGMRLQDLDISRCGVRDLSVLRGMPLVSLSCGGNPLASLEPLHGMVLRRLDIGETLVDSLEPLRGILLLRLGLSQTPVTSLEPLRGQRLVELIADGTRIVDLSPLRGMPLATLNVEGTAVADLSVLAGMPLTHLQIGRTRVRDAGALRGLGLLRLGIADTAVVDYTPLADLPLHVLVAGPFGDGRSYRGIERLRTHPSLTRIGTPTAGSSSATLLPAEEFWRRYDAGELGGQSPEQPRP